MSTAQHRVNSFKQDYELVISKPFPDQKILNLEILLNNYYDSPNIFYVSLFQENCSDQNINFLMRKTRIFSLNSEDLSKFECSIEGFCDKLSCGTQKSTHGLFNYQIQIKKVFQCGTSTFI